MTVTKDKHDLAKLPHQDDITREMWEPALIRVTNTGEIDGVKIPFGNFIIDFVWKVDPDSDGLSKHGGVLRYKILYDRLVEYTTLSEKYEVDVFEGKPIDFSEPCEVCEIDPRYPHVKGQYYGTHGWEQLHSILALVAKEIGIELDQGRRGQGHDR